MIANFTVFFAEIQLKNQNLKSVIWVPVFGCLNQLYQSPKQSEYVPDKASSNQMLY